MITSLDSGQLQTLQYVRKSSLVYNRYVNRNMTNPYMWNKKFTVPLCQKLDALAEGRQKKHLIVVAPPRIGKSFSCSVLFPAFFMGKCPTRDLFICSYSENLAMGFSYRALGYMQQDEHLFAFPSSQVDHSSRSKREFHTIKGGRCFAVGMKGTITGKGGHIIVCDDMFKGPSEARNPKHQETVFKFFTEVLMNRLEPNGKFLIVNKRWHENDLVGRLLQSFPEMFDILHFPALDEDGNALFQERFTEKDYAEQLKIGGTYHFEAVFQGRPRPHQGDYVNRDDLRFYEALPNKQFIKVISIDLAFDEEGKSNSCFSVYFKTENNVYLVDQVCGHFKVRKMVEIAKQMYNKHLPNNVLVEKKASGASVIESLEDAGVMGIEEIVPKDSKEQRLYSCQGFYESHNVFYPNPNLNPWVEEHIKEMISFTGRSDEKNDRVDCETQALNFLRGVSDSIDVYSF